MKPPVLVQIDLLGSPEQPISDRWLPLLAELDQAERPLVLVAERPDRWAPTRNRVDRAFSRQAELEASLRRAGGNFDAVVYLDVGLFSRRSQCRRSLSDLADRYGTELPAMRAIAPEGRLADALDGTIGAVIRVTGEEELRQALTQAR